MGPTAVSFGSSRCDHLARAEFIQVNCTQQRRWRESGIQAGDPCSDEARDDSQGDVGQGPSPDSVPALERSDSHVIHTCARKMAPALGRLHVRILPVAPVLSTVCSLKRVTRLPFEASKEYAERWLARTDGQCLTVPALSRALNGRPAVSPVHRRVGAFPFARAPRAVRQRQTAAA